YLLTRPGSVGRCVDVTLPACTSTAGCAAGRVCIGGHPVPPTGTGCRHPAPGPEGVRVLGAPGPGRAPRLHPAHFVPGRLGRAWAERGVPKATDRAGPRGERLPRLSLAGRRHRRRALRPALRAAPAEALPRDR